MKVKNPIFILTPLIPAILYLNISNFEKKLYVSTIIYILIITISKYFFDKEYLTKGKYIVNEILFFFILFLFVIVTQNRFLNIETITWDISSYLVASNEIDKGFLPLETQWESKGPLTIYIYYFLSKIVGNNYVYFKLINDIILYISIIGLFFIGKKLKISQLKIITASFSIASIFSIQWFVSEFTEFYCLPLIVLANYLHVKNNKQLQKHIGFLFGLSFLINQGSILFFLPIVIDNLKAIYKVKKDIFKIVLNYFFGFLTPVLFFIFIYWKNNLLDILIANYFDIPLGYVGENASSFYELRVFLREISILNQFTYFFIITLFFFYLIIIFKDHKFDINKLFDLINLNIIFSLLYYFVAGHNFYHHLIYFVYFSVFLIFKIKQRFQLNLIFLLILLSSLNSLYLSHSSSYDNLSSLSKTYENYPLKNLAKSIDSNFEDKSYTVFALDFVLILDYLDKTNYSYIVHPTNHYQSYISDVLTQLGKIEENNIIKLINQKPDVIICNKRSIDNGGRVMSTDPSTYGENIEEGVKHFCDYENLKKDYNQIDSKPFRMNPNLNYYFDPYKEMNVFIKKTK